MIKIIEKNIDELVPYENNARINDKAVEQLNRKCYTMELDPKYVDVIINRWETFTGKKAIKLN